MSEELTAEATILEAELVCIDPVNKPLYQGERFTKVSLVNKNKWEDEEGNTKRGAQEGELAGVSIKIPGSSDFIKQGQRYKVTIEKL